MRTTSAPLPTPIPVTPLHRPSAVQSSLCPTSVRFPPPFRLAGGAGRLRVTAEGLEEHAAVNYLAPSLLSLLLLPALKQAGGARVINVNSIVGHPLSWLLGMWARKSRRVLVGQSTARPSIITLRLEGWREGGDCVRPLCSVQRNRPGLDRCISPFVDARSGGAELQRPQLHGEPTLQPRRCVRAEQARSGTTPNREVPTRIHSLLLVPHQDRSGLCLSFTLIRH